MEEISNGKDGKYGNGGLYLLMPWGRLTSTSTFYSDIPDIRAI
jgi:hypothetical protein